MPALSLKWRLVRLLAIGGGFYVVLIAMLALEQRRLMYLPTVCTETAALETARGLGAEPWRNEVGTIIGWKHPARFRPAANRLIVFHGNAGNALDRSQFWEGFERLESGALWEVYVFEYPGYGARPGPISEPEFEKAAAAALRQMRQNDDRPVYAVGESLGSGVACALAHDEPGALAGVLLITPFSSMTGVAAFHYPTIPVQLIILDQWNNLAALPGYHGPVGMILAGKDTVIPIMEGRKLFDAAHQPKRLWVMPGVDHNDIDYSPDAPWWSEVSTFLLSGSMPEGKPRFRGAEHEAHSDQKASLPVLKSGSLRSLESTRVEVLAR